MNEIVEYDNAAGEVVPGQQFSQAQPAAPLQRLGMLEAWAREASCASSLAKALVTTNYVPKHLENNERDIVAQLLMGAELGFTPMAALRNIYTVRGTPALYARTMVALCQSRGHEIWTESSTDQKVVVCGRRKGSSHVDKAEWTLKRAQEAGYLSNKKYISEPQTMLYARAASEIARKIGADVINGIPYSVEELETQHELDKTVKVSAPRTLKRKGLGNAKETPEVAPQAQIEGKQEAQAQEVQLPHQHAHNTPPAASEPVPVPVVPAVEVVEVVEVGDVASAEAVPAPALVSAPAKTLPDEPLVAETITPAQLTKLQILLKEHNITEKADIYSHLSELTARKITSSKQLSKDEACFIIDRLENS
jgi:hypothetical protein